MGEIPLSKKLYLRPREVLKNCKEAPEMKEVFDAEHLSDEQFYKNYATYVLDQQCLNGQCPGFERY